ILPVAELNSVLLYLKSNSVVADVESNPVNPDVNSNTANPDVESNTDTTSDFILTDLNPEESALPGHRVKDNTQVQLKSQEGRLLLILPPESQVSASELSWSDIWQQIK
ncbi:MAG: septum site-determining protein MinC, partial [Nostoc sp.]